MAELLAHHTEHVIGSTDGRKTIWSVNDFYTYILLKLRQHPDRMSLVGAVAAFCELVEGAEVRLVDREQYDDLLHNDDYHIDYSRETFQMMFAMGFYEVSFFV